MTINIEDLNKKIIDNIQQFVESFNKININNLEISAKNDLLKIIEDFKSDISSLSNLEELSQTLEMTLKAKTANNLMQDMKSSTKYGKELKLEAEKLEQQKNNTLKYDKLTRD